MTQISQAEDIDMSRTTEERERFTIDGRQPQEVVCPESVEQIAGTLYVANEQRRAVVPIGLGAFLHLGAPPRRYDVALSLQRVDKVLDYQPTDMTVTVEAGVSLARLQDVLREHHQWLPIDPPLADRATIGGIIAANLSGPARLSHGAIRDSLIGLKVVRADGTMIKGGGRVVKNVAGYDIPKLFCGSFGTLGVIVEATFKVLPRPEAQTVLGLSFSAAPPAMDVALRLLGAELQPFFLEFVNFPLTEELAGQRSHHLLVSFAGVAEEVHYQRTRVLELARDGETHVTTWDDSRLPPLLQRLQDFPAAETAPLRCKATVLPGQVAPFCTEVETEAAARGLSAHFLAHAGNGLVYCRFPQLDSAPVDKLLSFIDWLRILARRLEGYVVIEDIDPTLKERVDVWGYVGGSLPLMKRLKETLDPNGILNPGRFVGGI